jgi:type II secretory pathway pseudopilin PulG
MDVIGMRPAEQYRETARHTEFGYAMAGLLVAIGALGLLLSMAMPTWQTFVKREKEAELVFRGGQYARAITLYGEQFAGAFPPNVETLVEGRFLRKAYTDPMTKDGEFEVITLDTLQNIPGVSPAIETGADGNEPTRTPFSQAAREQNAEGGPVMGVRSRSTEDSLMVLNGLSNYADWIFTPTAPGLLGGHADAQPVMLGAAGAPPSGQPGEASEFGSGGFGAFGEPSGGSGGAAGARGDSTTPRNGVGPTPNPGATPR